ncbi:cytochrome c nitrite reductase pentaheme subunit [Lacunisphaera limnophila]|uniref:Cytochrome c nitrite reductase pentaheme subunit n=1 Tax=Lacunisphaera limnophila TaxID=1838286 RepID=A0A1D8AZF7_9BACT|nr:cytochrome c3 family protein [Lacunisphaera limnophila]AOS46244.1 cytochrome c nitrite reductase pentaheme subunit [Lacunisphaera limnophila]
MNTSALLRLFAGVVWVGLSAAVWVRGEEAIVGGKPPPVVPNSECLDCHEAEFKARKKGQPKEWIGIKPAAYEQSAHWGLACVECHTSITEPEHPSKLPKVDCLSCHEDTAAKHAFHPRMALNPRPEGEDTSCASCHDPHEMLAGKHPDFPFAARVQAEACGRCHQEAQQGFLASAHALNVPGSDRRPPNCLSCHRDPISAQALKSPTVELKLAQAVLCESCHVGHPGAGEQPTAGAKFVAGFDLSVHGAALQAGKADAASCVDCHGAHAMNKAAVGSASINRLHLTETCARCHEKQADDYRQSVHAIALGQGNLDSAGCTSCHGEHDIKPHKDPASRVHSANLAQQVCAECHDSVRLTRRYGLSSDTFKTFTDSYHGLAVRGGAVSVVNCASCHGSHIIKSQEDPTSSVHKANLVQTCGECHPGAGDRFTIGAVHSSDEHRDGSPVLYWIATFYLILIAGTVGGMLVHNGLDFLKKIRRKLAIQKGELVEPHVAHRLYVRMTGHERLQHLVLVISFVVLVVTGFMLRFPEAWWVVGLRSLSARAFEWRGLIHRVAGVIMLAGGAWHVWYLAGTRPGRQLFLDLLPRWRDVTDPWRVLRYNLGLAPTKPAFGRFSYIEKVEYWAMVWGTLLMGITGAVLWFDNTSMNLFAKLGFDVARTVHYYEAILATLAIICWHFYFVIFNPDVYPMNLAWLTGQMSEAEMREEHPLQLEAMKAAEQTPPPGPPPGGSDPA